MDTDDKYAASLLQPLARAPRTPTTVDLARAIADGERRQRVVRLAGSAGVAAATALVLVSGWAVAGPDRRPETNPTAPAAPPPATPSAAPTSPVVPQSCTGRRLPLPPGAPEKSIISGADPSGRYVLGRYYPRGNFQYPLVIWDNLTPIRVDMPGQDQTFRDITATGIAVGSSYVNDKPVAWVYRNGKVSRLAGTVAEAMAINESGVIVGSVNGKPAMWASPTSEPTMLPMPGPDWVGHAAGIDEDGTIVGRAGSRVPMRGYLWRPGGTGEELPVPPVGDEPATGFTADAIRNGWVAGWAFKDVNRSRYLASPRWNLRTGAVDSDFPGRAEAINRHGWMAGHTNDGPAFVAGDVTVQLPPVQDAQPLTNPTVSTISDNGTVLAGQADAATAITPVAVVWTCR